MLTHIQVRSADASRSGCMVLSVDLCILRTPRLYCLCDHGLPAPIINMHMSHGLFARLVQASQCLQCRPALSLRLESQPHVALHRLEILTKVQHRLPHHLGILCIPAEDLGC